MLARLLLALLLAALAVPVTAAEPACHGGDHAMTTHAPTHHQPERDTAAHVCLGCIPVANWLGTSITAPVMVAAMVPAARIVPLVAGRTGPPALPPPRRG